MQSDQASADALSVARIDALLPQTQCTRCGYPGCSPYASAVAHGEADINQCPPGGAATIRALATLLGRPYKPLNPANGAESPPRIAWIDEERCIGCARCLAPCPVDAIVGASKFLHTVLTDRCTGCELCLAPCPVDCIEMSAGPAPAIDQPATNRERYQAHLERLERRAKERQLELAALKASAGPRAAAPSS
jgi:electron transport complex protein RnfB